MLKLIIFGFKRSKTCRPDSCGPAHAKIIEQKRAINHHRHELFLMTPDTNRNDNFQFFCIFFGHFFREWIHRHMHSCKILENCYRFVRNHRCDLRTRRRQCMNVYWHLEWNHVDRNIHNHHWYWYNYDHSRFGQIYIRQYLDNFADRLQVDIHHGNCIG